MPISITRKNVFLYIRTNKLQSDNSEKSDTSLSDILNGSNTFVMEFLNDYRKVYISKMYTNKGDKIKNQDIKAAIYCRTATTNYANLNQQRKQLEEFTNKLGVTSITFLENNTNGTRFIEDCSAINNLLKFVCENKLNIVIIDSLSRLSRDSNVCLNICNELHKNNVRLIVLDLLKESINHE